MLHDVAVSICAVEAIPLVVRYFPMTSVCCTVCLNCSTGNPRTSAIAWTMSRKRSWPLAWLSRLRYGSHILLFPLSLNR